MAFVTYKHFTDAQTAIREFDGANAKGQPIRLSLMSSGKPRNPFDSAEKPTRSLFERTERPRGRDARSLSPEEENEDRPARGRRSGRRGDRGGDRRGDRGENRGGDRGDSYVPAAGSPRRRNDGGRRRGREQNDSGRRTGNGRSKKTQEELDQEMEVYWGTSTSAPAAAPEAEPATNGGVEPAQTNAPAAANADDDIDMNIE